MAKLVQQVTRALQCSCATDNDVTKDPCVHSIRTPFSIIDIYCPQVFSQKIKVIIVRQLFQLLRAGSGTEER